jgi:hypothetical protein
MTHEYIGTKIVTAWPQESAAKARVCGVDCHPGAGSCNGYCTGKADRPPALPAQPGYAVKYADGYTSWSPKDVFEAAYIDIGHVSHLPPHQQRLIGERAELGDKLGKLRAFMAGEAFLALPEPERFRMAEQAVVMDQYHKILAARIAAFVGDQPTT